LGDEAVTEWGRRLLYNFSNEDRTKPRSNQKLVGSREYSFRTTRSSPQLLRLLKARYSGEWGEGDSYYYGDYLACRWKHDHESGWIRIYSHAGRNYCKFRLWTDLPGARPEALESWEMLQVFVRDELFRVIEAVDVEESNEID
jgi:hypothetical protein